MGQWGFYDDEGDSAADTFDCQIRQFAEAKGFKDDGSDEDYEKREEFAVKQNKKEFVDFVTNNFVKSNDSCDDALGFAIRILRGGDFNGLFADREMKVDDTVVLPKALIRLAIRGIRTAIARIEEEQWANPTERVETLRHEFELLRNNYTSQ